MNKITVTGLIAVHFLVTTWHGYAHKALAVALAPVENAFVYVAIVSAPLVAGFLVWTRHARVGAWVFFLSMLGAFLFGVYHHYIVASADNVLYLPQGAAGARSAFRYSAAALAATEFGSALYGAFSLRTPRRAPPRRG